ncbi:MAG: hypothetical protein SGBAC_001437, partial [Bacillariaceae sp.]
MSTIEKDGKENSTNRRMSGIDGKPSVAASIKTPSKSTRYSLGSGSKYYLKYVNSSAKKKQKKKSSMMQEDNPNFYLDYMNSATKKSKGAFDEDDTGNLSLLSIPEVTGNNNATTNNSSLDTSVLSLGSSSSEDSDLLNKTTSSDTTELTASNFVLAATSRAKARELSLDHSVWTKNETKKSPTKQFKPITEQPPTSRKPLGDKEDSSQHITTTQATLSQGSTATAAATPNGRRLSMRGASPSLRSRISASPKSLRKFTENLKKSRIQRQVQREEEAKKNAAANSALLNSSIASAMHSSLQLDGSELSVTKKKRSRSSMAPRMYGETSIMSNDGGDTTEDILGAMDEIFGSVNNEETIDKLLEQPKRSSVTATASAVDEAVFQEPTEENPRRDSLPVAVAFQRSRSSGVMERPLQLYEAKEALSSTKSPETSSNVEIESSNVSVTQSTPNKLAPTRQSIGNLRLLDSPAQNPRSTEKRLSHSRNNDTESRGDLGDILGGVLDDMNEQLSQERDTKIYHSPLKNVVKSQGSFGSREKPELSDENEREAKGETASIEVVGDLLGQLTQESLTGTNEDESPIELVLEGAMKLPGASVSHEYKSP